MYIMRKQLKFIHITKTAGTYIENNALSSNIYWGRFDPFYIKKYIFWHEPFKNIKSIDKDKYDWFLVVRNPYDRILSEYYCEWGGIGKININHTKEDMNKYIIRKLEKIQIKKYIDLKYHYIPQYLYMDNKCLIHVIKFENLNIELKKLFSDYNLNIKLSDKKVNTKEEKNKKIKFTINDFSEELINKINMIYKKDFEIFGYKMIKK